MPKQSHKLRALGDVASIIATAPSISAAAKRLGVSRVTLHGWIRDGKVQRPRRKRLSLRKVAAHESPEAFGRWVRRRYSLTPAESQILVMAIQAMKVAADAALKAETRLSAMKVADRLLARLDLEDEPEHGEMETTQGNVRTFPRGA